MSRFHDDSTFASDPVDIQLDRGRFACLHPESWISRLLSRRRDVIDLRCANCSKAYLLRNEGRVRDGPPSRANGQPS
ncbi:MAG: hypothetical protein AAGD10_16660 [Myxococcota bacterium]